MQRAAAAAGVAARKRAQCAGDVDDPSFVPRSVGGGRRPPRLEAEVAWALGGGEGGADGGGGGGGGEQEEAARAAEREEELREREAAEQGWDDDAVCSADEEVEAEMERQEARAAAQRAGDT